MRMIRTGAFLASLIIVAGLAGADARAFQAPQPELHKDLRALLKFKEVMTKDGGRWEAPNKDHKPEEEWSPSVFGTRFEPGVNAHTMRVKITGTFPKKNQTYVFWDGFFTWDPVKRKVVYFSADSSGRLAQGEVESISESGMTMVFTIAMPDGSVQTHRDEELFGETENNTRSFEMRNGKWEPKAAYTWKRVKISASSE